MPETTIVVLDDDRDQAEPIAEALARPGRRVRFYTSPVKALAAMNFDPPDVLVTDFEMPWMTGGDVVLAMKRRRPEIACILITGSVTGPGVAARVGAAFFVKPVDMEALSQEIDRLMAAVRENRI